MFNGAPGIFFVGPGGPVTVGFTCVSNSLCFAGSSSAIRTGWTAGGGAEWLLDQHWSAKIEYQFVDLGTEIMRVTALSVGGGFFPPGTALSSFNAAFRDTFNVVRVGLNYRY
jgi:outer membrane immunogenic protein